MVALRSILFNVLFFAWTAAIVVFGLPALVIGRPAVYFIGRLWSRVTFALLDHIVGLRYRILGGEHFIAPPVIIASKHQSAWDTMICSLLFPRPAYVLKRELTWIPFFGWYIMKMRMIPVDRGSRSKALKAVVAATKEEMARNPRQLIIYPEGTRRAPGDEPAYKYGIVEIYAQLGVPVVPVAHVAGLYWPRRKFLRYPGTIKARFLPPIPPGLGKDEFMQRLIGETEAACDQMLEQVR